MQVSLISNLVAAETEKIKVEEGDRKQVSSTISYMRPVNNTSSTIFIKPTTPTTATNFTKLGSHARGAALGSQHAP